MEPATGSSLLYDSHGLYGVHFGVTSPLVQGLDGVAEAFGVDAYVNPVPKRVFLRTGLVVRYDSNGRDGYLLFTGRTDRAAEERSLARMLGSIPESAGLQSLVAAYDANTFGFAVRENNHEVTEYFFQGITRGEMVAVLSVPELALPGLVLAQYSRLKAGIARASTDTFSAALTADPR